MKISLYFLRNLLMLMSCVMLIACSDDDYADSVVAIQPTEMTPEKASIVGGSEVPIENESYPWFTTLMTIRDNEESVSCGASLIDPQWVLTAAHCVYFVQNIIGIDIGRRDVKAKPDEFVRRQVALKFYHKRWDKDKPYNGYDIGLIKLDKPVDNVAPIRLASKQEMMSLTKGRPMIAMGMGMGNSPKSSPKLKHILVPYLPAKACKSIFILSEFRFNSNLSDTILCTVGGRFSAMMGGTAPGDSGGPLVTKDVSGKLIQYGTVSYGVPLGTFNAWARVPCFHDWINTIIKSDGNEVPEGEAICAPTQNDLVVSDGNPSQTMGKNPSDVMKGPL